MMLRVSIAVSMIIDHVECLVNRIPKEMEQVRVERSKRIMNHVDCPLVDLVSQLLERCLHHMCLLIQCGKIMDFKGQDQDLDFGNRFHRG